MRPYTSESGSTTVEPKAIARANPALAALAGGSIIAAFAALAPVHAAHGQDLELTNTYVRLANNSNALLWETAEPHPNQRIVAINIHADNHNSFEYFVGMELAARGFRALNVNYYGAETEFEEFLQPLAAAVRHARSLPGVEAVVFATHSGGGPMLAYYQEIAENGPEVCQEPSRIYPCDSESLQDLPPADALMFLSINTGAPHRFLSLDPAVQNGSPLDRDPSLDLYLPENGYDPETNTASHPPEFVELFFAGVHSRMEAMIEEAGSRLSAIEAGDGPYQNDDQFNIDGLAEGSLGARIYLADNSMLSQTRGEYLHLRADGTTPVEVVRSTRLPAGTPPDDRDIFGTTTRGQTLRHFLSFLALRTTEDFALTRDNIVGVDWRSSANSAPGNVQRVTVPTLVMGGSCVVHHVLNEITYESSAAEDKEFVVVEGANHQFNPCRPEFGDTRTRAFDYAEGWLAERF